MAKKDSESSMIYSAINLIGIFDVHCRLLASTPFMLLDNFSSLLSGVSPA